MSFLFTVIHLQAEALSLLVHLAEWLEGWAASLAGAGLNPDQLGAFITAKSEFWLFLVEVLTKLAENPDMEVRLAPATCWV